MVLTSSLNFIDVFSGAGGFSFGLEQAGHRCLLGIDHDHHAIKTFAKNHPTAKTFAGDVRLLSNKQLRTLIPNEQVHLVVGGPPCQGFSTVGPGNPKDERNHLFLEFCRIIKWASPEFFFMENVTGLLAKKNSSVLKAIFKTFSDLGYFTEVQVLHMEYYGVPEKRRRTLFFGSKRKKYLSFPRPTHQDPLHASQEGEPGYPSSVPSFLTVGDVFQELKNHPSPLENHHLQQTHIPSSLDAQRISYIPEGKGIRYREDEKNYLPKKLHLNIQWNSLPEGRLRQTKFQRLDRSTPAPTIMTHRHTYFHPTEPRYLTAREAASIQSFPPHFIFEGPLASQWRQIGNAVPPRLGKVIGLHLKELMATFPLTTKKSHKKSKTSPLKIHMVASMRKKAFHYKSSTRPTTSDENFTEQFIFKD